MKPAVSPLTLLLLLSALGGSSGLAQGTPPLSTPPPPAARAEADANAPALHEVSDYIRFESAADPQRPDHLDVAIGHFERNGVVVDLIGAVHIADAAYYQELNERFKQYGLVLYEMVGQPHPGKGAESLVPPPAEAVPGSDPGPGPAGGAPSEQDLMSHVHLLQNVVKSFLKLEFQMDGIDYTAANLRHADVDWTEFRDLLQKRQQSMFTLVERAMTQNPVAINIPGLESDAAAQETITRLFTAITSGDSATLKRTLAPILSETEELILQIEGDDGTVLVTERNKIVMEKLSDALAEGHKKIGIFYGAGHMPDLEKRLIAEGFQPKELDYLTAWSIPNTPPPPGGSPLDMLNALLHDDRVVDTIFDGLRKVIDEASKEFPTPPPSSEGSAPPPATPQP